MRYCPRRRARQGILERVEEAYGSPSYTKFLLTGAHLR
jgi:hypothetical protein